MAGDFYEISQEGPPDHLIPTERLWTKTDQFLGVEGFDVILFLETPSFSAERALIIYSEQDTIAETKEVFSRLFGETVDERIVVSATPPVYYALVSTFNRSMDQVSDEPLVRNQYKIEIPAQLAGAIHRAWAMLILQSAYPSTNYGGLDGTTYEFLVCLPARSFTRYAGYTWSPPQGTLPRDAVNIAHDIMDRVRAGEPLTPVEVEAFTEKLDEFTEKLTTREIERN